MIGYAGCGRLITFEFRMTEVTRCVVGGFTIGGGGGGVVSTTLGGPDVLLSGQVTQLPVIGGPLGPGSEIRGPSIAPRGAGGTSCGAELIVGGGVRGLLELS